jgi:hypothetical protein
MLTTKTPARARLVWVVPLLLGIHAACQPGSVGLSGSEFQVSVGTPGFATWPAVALAPDHHFVIGWGHFSWQDWSIEQHLARYGTAGVREGSNPPPHDSLLEQIQMGMAHDGRFVIAGDVTSFDNFPSGVMAQRYDAEGQPLGEPFYPDEQESRRPQGSDARLGVAPDGRFVVTWRTGSPSCRTAGEVHARRYDTQGAALGSSIRVNLPDPDSGAGGISPSVAVLDDGSFLVLWLRLAASEDGYECEPVGLYARQCSPDGIPSGAPIVVARPTTVRAASVVTDGQRRFAVVWIGPDGVMVRFYTPTGSPVSSSVLLQPAGDTGPLTCVAAMGRDGTLVLGWLEHGHAGYVILSRRYDPGGRPLGPALTISHTSPSVSAPAIAAGADGRFVVTWAAEIEPTPPDSGDPDTPEPQMAIFAQKIDSHGNPRGDEPW